LRQLIGVLRALIALGTPGCQVGVDDLPQEIRESRQPQAPRLPTHLDRDVASLDTVERDAMQAALHACAGNVSEAARRLGVSRSTLYRRLGSEQEKDKD
jgi:transcriptional regulator of acetoin/glycerol metabolism